MGETISTEIKSDIATLYVSEHTESFTDPVDGKLYQDIISITIEIDGSLMDVAAKNLSIFQEYCLNPTEIPDRSWMKTTEGMISRSSTCFVCDKGDLKSHNTVLLSLKGNSPGLHLLCSDCSIELANVTSKISSEDILSRTI